MDWYVCAVGEMAVGPKSSCAHSPDVVYLIPIHLHTITIGDSRSFVSDMEMLALRILRLHKQIKSMRSLALLNASTPYDQRYGQKHSCQSNTLFNKLLNTQFEAFIK